MCCALTIDVDVDFSNTIIYAAETIHPEINKLVHVLGYKNTVQNNVQRDISLSPKISSLFSRLFNTKPIFHNGSGNAMLLPFPAKPGTMSRKNVIETEDFKDILSNISWATMKSDPDLNPPEIIPETFSFQSSPRSEVEVFEAAGIYTVVLAQNILDIPNALSQVPIEKRPNPNPAIFKSYAKWYPDWTFALCCFNNEDRKEAHPLLWWFEPMFEDKLFLPALDAHDGNTPKLDQKVFVDHILAVGSSLSERSNFDFCFKWGCIEKWKQDGLIGIKDPSNKKYQVLVENFQFCPYCKDLLIRWGESKKTTYQKVDYRDKHKIPAEVKPFLMEQVIGQRFAGEMGNGDFYCSIDEVRKGIFNPLRQPPKTNNWL